MSGITSHVLDTSIGKPGAGITVVLQKSNTADKTADNGDDWDPVSEAITNDDGRVPDLTNGELMVGEYRITFHVADYFSRQKKDAFYPIVRIEFSVKDPQQHYHVPLLLNPFGYSTYRGS